MVSNAEVEIPCFVFKTVPYSKVIMNLDSVFESSLCHLLAMGP
jgi:hypothetical protein